MTRCQECDSKYWENERLRQTIGNLEQEKHEAEQQFVNRLAYVGQQTNEQAEQAAEVMLGVCLGAASHAVDLIVDDYKGRNWEDWDLIDEETQKDIRFQWEQAIITALSEAADE